MTYYAQRKSIKNGMPVSPNNRYGTRAEMERQFHLYCVSAATNEADNDVDSVEGEQLNKVLLKENNGRKLDLSPILRPCNTLIELD